MTDETTNVTTGENIGLRAERRRLLTEACAEVLGLEHVEPGDRFFGLGGDSISCVRFVALVRRQGLEISVRDVLLDDGIASLADRARERPEDG